ncbi:MAG: aminoacetone oxidase family FAD-binding enzyme, partial [Clostridia bacterium]|nr:aminoacetone oxidase family FAD-binding enzyme [Clostridia bacterium]
EKSMGNILIIGGGASGLMCALQLAKQGKSVTVLEKNDRVGKKLLVTGNGKCNLTNVNLSLEDYNTPTIREILEEFSPQRVIEEFALTGLLTKVDSEGRVYPYSESANTVVNVLMRRLDEYGVNIVGNALVESVSPTENGWKAVTSKGEYVGDKVVFACGSNATSGLDSMHLMSRLGHRVAPFRYAIAPLLCDEIKGARGVRAKVYAALFINGKETMGERGEILFKDDALSGILAFRLSSALARFKDKVESCKVVIDFVPDLQRQELAEFIYSNCSVYSPLEGILHKAIAQNVISRIPMDRSWVMSPKKANDIAKACKTFEVNILGVSSRANAQVACGGVALDELDMRTLQSKLHSGLYCIGESADVDGLCGGCNLHWAWASAMAASKDMI